MAIEGLIPDGSTRLSGDTDERKMFDKVDDGDKKDKVKEVDVTSDDDDEGDNDEEEGQEEEKEEDGNEEDDEDGDGDNPDEEDSDEDDEDESELKTDSIYQALKTKHKDIFKEFPELKHVLFREREYTELFPSVEDAREAASKAEILNNFESDISSGKSETLLEALKDNKEGLEGFVGSFADTVQEKLGQQAYLKFMYPEFKKMLRAAMADDNENIKKSAENINYFIFGDTNVKADAPAFKTRKKDEEDSVSKREREFNERVTRSFETDVKQTGERRVMRLISAPFKDSGMSAAMQEMISERIFKQLNKELSLDKRHMGNIQNKWKEAKSKGFTTDSKDSILNTFLSRAKVLIPKIRAKVISDAKLSAKEGTFKLKKKAIRVTPSGVSSTRRDIPTKIDRSKIDMSSIDERAALDGNFPLRK